MTKLTHASTRRLRRMALARRGFTLVELMVSLVAGVVIAVAVVGLARAATTTFHEQVRLSAVEMSVRNASERLRRDLLRISFMSTGNIHLAGNDNPSVPMGHRISVTAGTTGAASRYGAKTDNLQGIKIIRGGSKATSQGADDLASKNKLNPDSIIITGNLTTDDSFQAQWIGAGSCGGGQLELKTSFDAANQRIASASGKLAISAFLPGDATKKALARIVDPRGCQHYAVVCAVSGDLTHTLVDLDKDVGSSSGILTKSADGTTCGGEEGETFSINPIARVRWTIDANTIAAIAADPIVDTPANKFNMLRQYLDADSSAVGTPEIVAEYAIDMKFGVVVDDPAVAAPNNIKSFDMDSASVETWTKDASGTLVGQEGPQRVRAVRYRVAMRSALPDRTKYLEVPPGPPFISRYCLEKKDVDGVGDAACTKFARVRSLISEVSLMNQATMAY